MGINVSTNYAVNELGELVVEAGTGSDNAVELLPEDYVPVNLTNGKMKIKFPPGIGGGGNYSASGVMPNATPVVVALGGAGPNSVYRTSVNPTAGDTVTVESGTSSTGPWRQQPMATALSASPRAWARTTSRQTRA